MSGDVLANSYDEWRALAVDKLAAAQHLLSNGHWQIAFEIAGAAVECALKAHIMRREGLNSWPIRSDRKEVYSHNLGALAQVAKLDDALLHEIYSEPQSPVGLAWLIVKDWRVEIRYAAGTFPSVRARDMVQAVEGGLLQWLLTCPN